MPLIVSALWSVAAAQTGGERAEACEPLDEATLRSYVLDAQASIDRGDVAIPEAILADVDARVPCLGFVVSPWMWAELLVAKAIVAFARGEDWESPMASALRLRPAIDRGVGPGHPLARWEPPPAPPAGPPLPPGVVLYVDGSVSPTLPPGRGISLVQKTDGRFVNSQLLIDEALPLSWATGAVEQPARIRGWGRIGASLGSTTRSQSTSWTSDVYPELEGSGASVALTGAFEATFFSPFGIFGAGELGFGPAVVGDVRGAAIARVGALTIGGGPGRMVVPVDGRTWPEDVDEPETLTDLRILQYWHGIGLVRSRLPPRLDAQLCIGGGNATRLFELGVGVLVGKAPAEFRLAVTARQRAGVFVQEGLTSRELVSSAGSIGLSVEWMQGD